MIVETYLGRKIRIVKGRGRDFGHSRVMLNGVALGYWQGDEIKVAGRIKSAIDGVAAHGIDGNAYGIEWYAPGTVQDCGNGHAREIGGKCTHSWCIKLRGGQR